MNTGFLNEALDVRTGNGADDSLLEPLFFNRRNGDFLRAPIGSTTDGLSTPKIIRILPGYDATGDDWWSGVFHDSGYRNFMQVFNGVWVGFHPTRKKCDHLILEAMATQGVGWWRRHIIFVALRLFGGFAFRSDRRKFSLGTIVPKQ